MAFDGLNTVSIERRQWGYAGALWMTCWPGVRAGVMVTWRKGLERGFLIGSPPPTRDLLLRKKAPLEVAQ
jgi:hypothetical protein